MLRTFIATLALAVGFALPHGHFALPALTAHVPVTSADTNGGGPPTSP